MWSNSWDCAHSSLFTRCDPTGISCVSSALFFDRGNETDENAPSFEDLSLSEALMELYSSLLYLFPHQNKEKSSKPNQERSYFFKKCSHLQIVFQLMTWCIAPSGRDILTQSLAERKAEADWERVGFIFHNCVISHILTFLTPCSPQGSDTGANSCLGNTTQELVLGF